MSSANIYAYRWLPNVNPQSSSLSSYAKMYRTNTHHFYFITPQIRLINHFILRSTSLSSLSQLIEIIVHTVAYTRIWEQFYVPSAHAHSHIQSVNKSCRFYLWSISNVPGLLPLTSKSLSFLALTVCLLINLSLLVLPCSHSSFPLPLDLSKMPIWICYSSILESIKNSLRL